MSSDVYDRFVGIVTPLIKDKKFPINDVCRVFDIIIKISPYFNPESQNEKSISPLKQNTSLQVVNKNKN
jgi:hypothetical protein